MTTLAEYKTAQETVNSFRGEALARVKDYVRSGQSALGNAVLNEDTEYGTGGVYLDFSMEIAVKNGTVLVWATDNDDETIPFRVPVEVVDGVLTNA